MKLAIAQMVLGAIIALIFCPWAHQYLSFFEGCHFCMGGGCLFCMGVCRFKSGLYYSSPGSGGVWLRDSTIPKSKGVSYGF